MSNLYWLTEEQMARLRPYFPKSHSTPRVDDRRVLSGIILVNRNGRRWRDAPSDYTDAAALLDDLPKAQWLLGDRGYDADWFRVPCRPRASSHASQVGGFGSSPSNTTSAATGAVAVSRSCSDG